MQFYLLAPFLVRLPTRWLMVIFSASLALRTGMQVTGLAADPYAFYLSPCELSLFLTGILSHRLLGHWSRLMPMWSAWLAAGCLYAILVFYPWRSGLAVLDWMKFGLFLALFLTLPLLAKITAPTDRFLGDLSYPAYLVHLPIIYAVFAFWPSASFAQVASTIGLVFIVSAAIVVLVDRPVFWLRHTMSTGNARIASKTVQLPF